MRALDKSAAPPTAAVVAAAGTANASDVMPMPHRIPGQVRSTGTAPLDTMTCPSWCVTPHGVHGGEEDWVHISAPLPFIDGVLARICMTTDPRTQSEDGPYVLLGGTELTPAEAHDLGLALQALASAAAATTTRLAAP